MQGTWTADDIYRVDEVDFVADPTSRFTSTAERFCLVKRPDLVQRHLALMEELAPSTVVELGMFQGGGAALILLAAEPDVFVGIEYAEERIPALDTVAARRPNGSVHLHYGTDQSDVAAVRTAVADALDGRPLDLVIDDASHLVDETRTSFNTLFPLIRPGGNFVLEDWSWAHILFGAQHRDKEPLTRLVFELTMALPQRIGLIDHIHLDRDWAVIKRGDLELDPLTFDLRDFVNERGKAMLKPHEAQG